MSFPKVTKYKIGDKIISHFQTFSPNYYEIEIPKITNWKLSDETKKIGPYSVKKAVCEYGGRTWNAWYAPELSFPYGPYVFHGLPGLVVDIADTENDYHFSLVSNSNLSSIPDYSKIIFSYMGFEEIKLKEKDWQKLLQSRFEHPLPGLLSGEFMMRHEDGREFSAQDYREEIERIQNYMLRVNNPLEKQYRVKDIRK